MAAVMVFAWLVDINLHWSLLAQFSSQTETQRWALSVLGSVHVTEQSRRLAVSFALKQAQKQSKSKAESNHQWTNIIARIGLIFFDLNIAQYKIKRQRFTCKLIPYQSSSSICVQDIPTIVSSTTTKEHSLISTRANTRTVERIPCTVK